MLFHPIFEVGLIFSHFKKKLVNLVIAVDPELSTIDSNNIATNVEAHIERNMVYMIFLFMLSPLIEKDNNTIHLKLKGNIKLW